MQFRCSTLLILAAIAPLVFALALPSAISRPSNCGGNSAALTDVRNYHLIATMAAEDSQNGEFDVTSATDEQRRQLALIAEDPWLRGGRLLVSTQPYRPNSNEPPRLIVVCDRPFTNVPRYTFRAAPPTHAAAYSDGSTKLLTTKEFAALNRAAFVPLHQIITPQN